MPFKQFQKWINEDFQTGITVLFPGSFKPPTGAHLDLIKRYLVHPDVNEIQVLVGPGIRDGINQKIAVDIFKKLTEDLPKVKIISVIWPSPVLTAYKIIEEAQPGTYALAASSKEEENSDRIKRFVNQHGPQGKFKRPGINVIELPIDIEPLKFEGRNDDVEGKPISASVLREDIIADDLDNFVTGYPDNTEEQINFVWDCLRNIQGLTEVLHTSGSSTDSSPGNYDRSAAGYHYKSIFPIVEDDDEDEEVNELLKINEMAGAAGHLMSPWEAGDLTFGEIRDLINKALSGKLENVSEKLDGANLLLTYRYGDVYIARSSKHVRNRGEEAIKWDSIADFVNTPEAKEAYGNAGEDFHKVFKSTGIDIKKIFNEGERWLNVELLNPKMENIVPYGERQLRIHNLWVVDKAGKTIDVLYNGELDELVEVIEKAQKNGKMENTHLIAKTNKVQFQQIKDIELIQEGLIRKLQTIMDKNHLDDENTIADYLVEESKLIIKEAIRSMGFSQDKDLTETLSKRWGAGDKSITITKVLKGKEPAIVAWAKEADGHIDQQIGDLLDPIVEIFSRVGIAVLQNLSGISSTNPTKTSETIKKKAEDVIQKIKEFVEKEDVESQEDFDKKVKYLETQLKRLEQSGGLDGVAPVEGIVFEYNGRLFKLTGSYLPILKMISFFRFGKNQ